MAHSKRASGGSTFDRHRGSGHRAGVIAPQRNTIAHALDLALRTRLAQDVIPEEATV